MTRSHGVSRTMQIWPPGNKSREITKDPWMEMYKKNYPSCGEGKSSCYMELNTEKEKSQITTF